MKIERIAITADPIGTKKTENFVSDSLRKTDKSFGKHNLTKLTKYTAKIKKIIDNVHHRCR